MKVVILAGGIGSRIQEESHLRPKPMIEIGGKPILWHIMKIYASRGFSEFIICLGYRGYVIREYFANYVLHNSDVTVDLATNSLEFHSTASENWRVTLAESGEWTETGGRLRRVSSYLDDQPFCMTYGDGVSSVDPRAIVDFHRRGGYEATLTAVRPPGRFGALRLDGGDVREFIEKPAGDGGYINGGFFVLEPSVLARISGDATVWEREPLQSLAREGRLGAFRHDGFWQPMDTLRDKRELEKLWDSGNAPWKCW